MNEQQCSTVNEQQCSTVIDQQCHNVLSQECSTVSEHQCNSVPSQECSTVNEVVCSVGGGGGHKLNWIILGLFILPDYRVLRPSDHSLKSFRVIQF